MDWRKNQLTKLNAWFKRLLAGFWSAYYRITNRLRVFAARFGWHFILCILLAAFVASLLLVFTFEDRIKIAVDATLHEEDIANLLLTLGGALATASAIVFSLIIFSVQVNVERLPHRLFQRFGFDIPLVTSFIATFAISVAVAASTLVINFETAPFILVCTIWGAAMIGAMFLFAFKRTLALVNPLLQIFRVQKHAQKNMQWWSIFFDRFTLGLSQEQEQATDDRRDTKRTVALRLHGYWTNHVQRDVEQLVAISSRSAEIGDHQIARGALNALDGIHEAYIKTKGLTFFAHNPFFDTGQSSDAFFLHSLESLRQAFQAALVRGDEKQAEYCFEALAVLAHRCLRIDYGVDYANKTHAHLAAGYLARSIESSVQMKSPDVLMVGVRFLGGVAKGIIDHERPERVAGLLDDLSKIAAVGALRTEYQPVTLTAIEQYQHLTVKILIQDDHDIRYIVGRIFQSLSFLGNLLIKNNETPFQSSASSCLAPFFSMTSPETLHQSLMQITNGIIEDQIVGDHAVNFIRNFDEWFEEGREAVKQLMVEAFQLQSQLAPDIVTWIKGNIEIAMALSNDDACPDNKKSNLQTQAERWVWIFSFIPDQKEAVAQAETFQFTETLFEIGMIAKQRDCEDAFIAARGTLAHWCTKAAKHDTGQAILETSIYALATMSIAAEGSGAVALQLIQSELEKNELTDEIKQRTARDLRERRRYRDYGYVHSSIENTMRDIDQAELGATLTLMANMLAQPQ